MDSDGSKASGIWQGLTILIPLDFGSLTKDKYPQYSTAKKY